MYCLNEIILAARYISVRLFKTTRMISRDVEFTRTGPNQLSAAAPEFPTLTFDVTTMEEQEQAWAITMHFETPFLPLTSREPDIAVTNRCFSGQGWKISCFYLCRANLFRGKTEHCVCNTAPEAVDWLNSFAKDTF